MSFLTRKKLGRAIGISSWKLLAGDIEDLNINIERNYIYSGHQSNIVKEEDVFLADYITKLNESMAAQSLDATAEFIAEARQIQSFDLLLQALIIRADVLFAQKRYIFVIQTMREAQAIVEETRESTYGIYILDRMAKAYAYLGDWPTTLSIAASAIAVVEQYRNNVSGEFLQSSYLCSRKDLYSFAIFSAYMTNDFHRLVSFADLSKCRSVINKQESHDIPHSAQAMKIRDEIELTSLKIRQKNTVSSKDLDMLRLKQRMLWDKFLIERSNSSTQRLSISLDIHALKSLVRMNDVIIYYYWISNQLFFIIIIDREHSFASLIRLSGSQRLDLEKFALNVTANLQQNSTKVSYRYVENIIRFADLLLPDSVRSFILQKTHLIISPHKLLHAVPFQLLPWHDGEHKYLIQKHAISYIPNLKSISVNHDEHDHARIICMGSNTYDLEEDHYDSLEYVEEELLAITSLYKASGKKALCYLGKDASVEAIKELFGGGDYEHTSIFHFAGHCSSVDNDNPMEACIVLNNGRLEGLSIASLNLSGALVILNGCHSSQRAIKKRSISRPDSDITDVDSVPAYSDDLPGDDIYGLQASFFAAGASAIVGCLWPVKDDVSFQVMHDFHANLIAGLDIPHALQHAIVKFLSSADLIHRHPYFWGSYIAVTIGGVST